MMFADAFIATLDAKQSRQLAEQLNRQAAVLRQRADMLDPPPEARDALRERMERSRRCARLVCGYVVSGLSLDDAVDRVARRFGMPQEQVLQLFKTLEGRLTGVPRRRGERMARLHRNKWSVAAIARRFGVTKAAVYRQLDLGAARREGRKEARKLMAPPPTARSAAEVHHA